MKVAAALTAGLVCVISPATAAAQVVTVVVRDSATAEPLGDALVSLLDTAAALLGATRTSRDGRTAFRTPAPAHFAFRVQRIGWRQLISPWIAVASTDTLEITFRLARIPVKLTPVLIAAQRDSISRLIPLGINPKSFAGRIIVPAEVAARAPGARDYVDVIGSVGLAGLITNNWRDAKNRERRCIGSSRSPSRRDCVVVYVDNVRTDAEGAIDLATPENLDSAIWLPAIDAGVLYGGDAAAGVLHLFTKAYRRTR